MSASRVGWSSVRAFVCVGVVALGLVACGSSETEPEDGSRGGELYTPPPRPNPKLDLDFNNEWDDLEVLDNGERNPLEVAIWATERRNKAQQCLRHEPAAILQAIEVLQEVVDRVPTDSRARGLLAECYFRDAAYWFRAADVTAYAMTHMQTYGTLPANQPGVAEQLTDEEKEQLVEEFEAYIGRANRELDVVARKALRHFLVHHQQRPEIRGSISYVWKLYFMLQNYGEALRWLEYGLAEMDRVEVSRADPTRQAWEEIRADIEDYLAQRRLQGDDLKIEGQGLLDELTSPSGGGYR